jgi:hypothetical protein
MIGNREILYVRRAFVNSSIASWGKRKKGWEAEEL